MSLYNDASLAMIPSAVKDGKLYSIRPTDGSGDFTFSRGSNLAATRVDVNGLIEKGRENLLLQSNSFDTTWTKQDVTLTSGQSGYDGSSDAWLLSKNAARGQLNVINSADVCTFSVYAKAATLNWIRLYVDISGSNTIAFYNLASGIIGTTTNVIDANIYSLGNGWYRCTMTAKNGVVRCRIAPADADNDIDGTSGSIYIQDAQLEVGLVATDYIETTTTTAVSGITEDLPRLDYSGGASCPSLLLEPQRTNAFTQSEYFDSSDWTTFSNGETIIINSVVSPDGTQNASTLEGDGTATSILIRQDVTLTTSVDYTFSIFAKKGTNDFLAVSAEGFSGATNTLLIFDLNNSVVTTGVGNIDDYGNGWLRCSYTIPISTDGVGRFLVYPAYNGTTRAFPTSGDANGQNIYIYGAQLEESSYPTSYIPTYGASVTRNADSCELTGVADLIGDSEGTLYFEGSFSEDSDDRISLSDGTDANFLSLDIISGQFRLLLYNSFAVEASIIGGSANYNTDYKIALKYAENNFALYVDGIKIGEDLSGSTFNANTLTDVKFENGSGNLDFYGNVKQLTVFPTALTDAECIALTTL